MDFMRVKREKKALTLIEVVLALAIGSLLVVSLAAVFRISHHNWQRSERNSTALQHARVALDRITSDLRYATRLLSAESPDHSDLEFETTNLEDSDAGVEVIQFYRSAGGHEIIYRRVDGGLPGAFLAGVVFSEVITDVFVVTPMKLDGSNNLVPLDIVGGDTLDMAVAVQLTVGMENTVEGDKVAASSLVRLRNI